MAYGPYNRKQVADRARASTSNEPNGCFKWTRTMAGLAAVGDYDGDGTADAEDGWKAASGKHPGDRNPPEGVEVFYGRGSHDDGHAAISLGGGKIRSTDAAGLGHPATVDLDWPTRAWGLPYLGWAEGERGVLIPEPAAAKKPAAKHPAAVQDEIEHLNDLQHKQEASGHTKRAAHTKAAKQALKQEKK